MHKNWKTYNFGELVDLKQGLAINKKTKHLLTEDSSELPLFKINNLIKNTVDHYVKKSKVPKQCIVKEDELIYTRTGQVGLIFKGKNGCMHNNCFKIIPNEKLILKDYIYWFLRQPHIVEYANNIASGSVQKDLNHKSFKSIEIDLPKALKEQKAIAQILSAIDNKIENNLAINKILEDMAMALYKHWFVDFGPFQKGEFIESELGKIPKGWEVKRLDEVAYKNSKTFDFKGIKEVVFVNTGDVQNGSFLHENYFEVDSLPGQAKKVIEPDDILYSEIRPKNKRFAYVDFDSSNYVVSTKFMIIRNNEKINNKLLYRILTRQDTINEFQLIAESRSGTFPQITFDAIGHFPIALPNIEVQNNFQSIVDTLEIQQSDNLKEIKSLTKLRDTLLPKLISGEVRLKEFREEVETII